MLTLHDNDIANLVRCTDHEQLTADDAPDGARSGFLDGVDRYIFGSRLGFSTTSGAPTHEGWLATVACLTPPHDGVLGRERLRAARATLARLHDTLFGDHERCLACAEAFSRAQGPFRDSLLLVRETHPATATPSLPKDHGDAVARLRLLARAERLRKIP